MQGSHTEIEKMMEHRTLTEKKVGSSEAEAPLQEVNSESYLVASVVHIK